VRSKNKPTPTAAERAHIERVKSLPCSVCDAPAPSEAPEPNQGQWFTSIALCTDCHRGPVNGWHGQRVMWRIHKLDELGALNITIARLFA
jgi:hypothetical protein